MKVEGVGSSSDARAAGFRARRFAAIAARALRDLHVSLPEVRLESGVDPCRVLEAWACAVPSREHDSSEWRGQLLSSFALFGDRHTVPSLDEGADVYSLPFTLCRATRRTTGEDVVCLEAIRPGRAPADFAAGVEITHWNGVPVLAAAQRLGWHQRGNHPRARTALGIRSLPHRPTGSAAEPSSEWVDVTYRQSVDAPLCSTRFEWDAAGGTGSEVTLSAGLGSAVGLGRASDATSSRCVAEPTEGLAGGLELFAVGEGFCLGWLRGSGRRLGVIKLGKMPPLEDIDQVLPFLNLPMDGLILDLRGNPGGEISTADLLSHRLVGGEPDPVRFQFRNTDSSRRMLGRHSAWRSWAEPSCNRWLAARAMTEESEFLASTAGFNGRIGVLVDALTYSAAEILAGTLQSRCGAVVLGVDSSTGGGMANSWGYRTLEALHSNHQVSLPPDARLRTRRAAERRDRRVSQWGRTRGLSVRRRGSGSESGCWLLGGGRAGRSDVRLEWNPLHDVPSLLAFEADAPLLEELPQGFGLGVAVRRALVGEVESDRTEPGRAKEYRAPGRSGEQHLMSAVFADVQVRRGVEDVVHGDVPLFRRCCRYLRSAERGASFRSFEAP